MTYLSEDPTYLTIGFLVLAAAFTMALRVSQQAKYLLFACLSCGLAVLTVAVEHFWVTDNERIEKVVYDLGDAVQHSNAEAVLKLLAPNVQYSKEDSALSPDATRELIRTNVSHFKFDLLRVGRLKTNVGEQSRRGTAEFQVLAHGIQKDNPSNVETGSAVTTWSLGFQETAQGVWKVSRISPVSVPAEVLAFTGGLPRPDRLRLGYQNESSPGRAMNRPPQTHRRNNGRSRGYPGGPHSVPHTDMD